MKAVFRRELSSYFTGLSGYVFGAFLLLFAGIYTMAYNIRAAVSNFEYVLSSMSFIFLGHRPYTHDARVRRGEAAEDRSAPLFPAAYDDRGRDGQIPRDARHVPDPAVHHRRIPGGALSLRQGEPRRGLRARSSASSSSVRRCSLSGRSSPRSRTVRASRAGLCFAALLVNYFLASLSSFFSSTAFASFAALTFAVAALALIFYLMTKSGFASAVIFIASEVLVFVFYTFKERQLRGTVPEYTLKPVALRAL